MQNQGIAQVERQGRSQPIFNVIRVVSLPGLEATSHAIGAWQGRIPGIGGNSGTFPGFRQAGLKGQLGMLKPSPINKGAAAVWRLSRALRSRFVPACPGDLS